MKEQDFINVVNLTNIRTAIIILGDVVLFEEQEASLKEALKKLVDLEKEISNSIKIKE